MRVSESLLQVSFGLFFFGPGGLGTGMLSLPWAMAGASVAVGSLIIVPLGHIVCRAATPQFDPEPMLFAEPRLVIAVNLA